MTSRVFDPERLSGRDHEMRSEQSKCEANCPIKPLARHGFPGLMRGAPSGGRSKSDVGAK
jgi:hypothetical protein